jgi:hypothetical protein
VNNHICDVSSILNALILLVSVHSWLGYPFTMSLWIDTRLAKYTHINCLRISLSHYIYHVELLIHFVAKVSLLCWEY